MNKLFKWGSAALIAAALAFLPATVTKAQTSITWTNVIESGMATGTGDDFGPQTIFSNPVDSSKVYVATDHHGFWRSTDYGQNFTHYNTTTYLDTGKIWAGQIAPDGSYMLLGLGNGANECNGTSACNQFIHKSTDDGLTWTATGTSLPGGGNCDPYSIDISPTDYTHVIMSCHGASGLYESTDSGVNWTSLGTTGGSSAFVQFLATDSTILVTSDGDNNPSPTGTFRGVKSGGSWTFTRVANASHWHGSHQIFVDTVNSRVLLPSGQGIWTSSDNGATWTNRDTDYGGTLICTPAWCYTGYGYPNHGDYGPGLMYADRNNPVTWTNMSDPGMGNGPARWATLCHGGAVVIMSVNRDRGVWRGVTGESCSEAGGGGGGGGGSNRRRFRIVILEELIAWLEKPSQQLLSH